MASAEQPVPTIPEMSEHEWGDLLYSIEQEKCIVVVGPEVYTAPGEASMDKRLAEFLRKQSAQLRIRVNDNGWYHLQPGGNETSPVRQIKEFYNRPTPHAEESLKTLARIRFPIYISLTPDTKLRQAFTGYAADFETYVRNKPYREDVPVPTPERPMVYQLLGNIEDRNSMVLTYDDFYDYLKSVFTGRSMSPLLKEAIISAEYFLFLGIPFDQWYMHLFMRVLNQSKEKLQTLKVAVPFDAINADSCAEQYTIKFVDDKIVGFISELLARCEQHNKSNGLIRRASYSKDEQAKVVNTDLQYLNELTELIVGDRFEEVYDRVKKLLIGTGERGRGLLHVFIQLRARHAKLEEENALGILHYDNYNVELNRLRKAYIDQIDGLKILGHQLNLSS